MGVKRATATSMYPTIKIDRRQQCPPLFTEALMPTTRPVRENEEKGTNIGARGRGDQP